MRGVRCGFNLYLLAFLLVALAGCSTTKDPNDKLSTVLRVHLEAIEPSAVPAQTIAVYRENPVTLQVESLYLLTEDHVVRADVVDQHGTYAIRIQFNEWAVPLLEHNSSSYQGRRLAILAQWGPRHETARWLAAPRLNQKVLHGTLTFTPDATREEALEIVAGLNNHVRKQKKALAW